ncbi:MAG TPA: sulfatase [Bryobacteraceae bacterium]|nr:sulfatase [Bryobacteraceae bacterium]
MHPGTLPRRAFLKGAGGALLAAAQGRAAAPQPPNFVLILCDDLGYGDLHCYGSQIPTPNIDQMAREGVRFEQFYSTSNVCSPSRASLLTGRYAPRVGVPDVIASDAPIGLAKDETTIAEMLRPVGYRSMCVGKWHLGRHPQYLPTNRGFDEYYGIPYSNDMAPSVLLRDQSVIESPVQLNTLTQRYTQQAVNFIQRAQGSPFFLFLSHTFPHIPLAASAAFNGKSGMGLYADVVEELDWSVGRVLQSLKDNGVDNNTMVILTSDNGPWYQGSAGRLRGRKGSSYEGGVREPFIARWPGQIPPGALRARGPRVSRVMASTLDILPTLARLSNATLPAKPLDGLDIWPVLAGQPMTAQRDVFLYFDSWNLQCARMGPWKLHVARYDDFAWSPDPAGGRHNLPLMHPELYNLENDPDESYDVAAQNPQIVADIQQRIQQLLPTFPAQVMNSWQATMAMKVAPTPEGALPAVQP